MFGSGKLIMQVGKQKFANISSLIGLACMFNSTINFWGSQLLREAKILRAMCSRQCKTIVCLTFVQSQRGCQRFHGESDVDFFPALASLHRKIIFIGMVESEAGFDCSEDLNSLGSVKAKLQSDSMSMPSVLHLTATRFTSSRMLCGKLFCSLWLHFADDFGHNSKLQSLRRRFVIHQTISL